MKGERRCYIAGLVTSLILLPMLTSLLSVPPSPTFHAPNSGAFPQVPGAPASPATGNRGAPHDGAAPAPGAEGQATGIVHVGVGFVQNAGQVPNPEVRYAGTATGVSFGFAESAIFMEIRPEAHGRGSLEPRNDAPSPTNVGLPPGGSASSQAALLEIRFAHANRVDPVGRAPTKTLVSYFLGNDPSAWLPSIPTYREIVYEGLYDGIDLVYRSTEGGVKYDLVVAPGADPNVIEMVYSGAASLSIHADGSLAIESSAGPLRDSRPVANQDGSDVPCEFELRSPNAVGFSCSGYDSERPFTIDPLVSVSYWGGDGEDYAGWIKVGAANSLYVADSTSSSDFLSSPGAFNGSTPGTSENIYVAKFNANRTGFEFVAMLGGNGTEDVKGFDVDGMGYLYVAGSTRSADYPTTPGALNRTYNGALQGYLFKLTPDGAGLVYSTYVGGSDNCASEWIEADELGQLTFSVSTFSSDLPTTSGAFDSTSNGGVDAFLGKLNANGSALLFGAIVGGSGDDYPKSLAADTHGDLWVTMISSSRDFPTTPGALDEQFNGGSGWGDTAVVKLSADGRRLLYSTFLGGSLDDEPFALALAPDGGVLIGGTTNSTDFPVTAGSYDTSFAGQSNASYPFKGDIYLAKLNASGASLDFATYLGGVADDDIAEVRLDLSGYPVVVGITSSEDFPTTPTAFDRTFNGDMDGFVARFTPDGSQLLYSSFVGGGGYDEADGVAFGVGGEVYVSGLSDSTDFPNNSQPFNATYGDGTTGAYLLTLLLTAPTDLQARPSSNRLYLSWDLPPELQGSNVVGHRVYEWSSGSFPVNTTDLANSTNYSHFGLLNGQEYCFQVSAVTTLGETERSDTTCATPVGRPSPPVSLVATRGTGWVNLSWGQPLDDGGGTIQGYLVFRGEGSANLTFLANVSGLTFSDSNVTPGVTYRYRVLAYNSLWDGDLSSEVAAAPLPRTSTVGPLPAGIEWVAVFAIVVMASALILSPRGTFVLSLLFAVPLFTRLRRDDVKSQYNRGRIVQFVTDHPGASYSEVRRRLDLPNGNCAYHLRVLERSGEIRRSAHGASVRFYPSSVRPGAEGLPPLTADQRDILDVLLELGSGTTGEIADALRAREPARGEIDTSYHLRVLHRRASLISAERSGTRTTYFITPEQRENLMRNLKAIDSIEAPHPEGPLSEELELHGLGTLTDAGDVMVSLPAAGLSVLSDVDHVGGLVRLKVAFDNRSASAATELGYELDFDEASLRLDRVNPPYPLVKGRFAAGNLPAGERKSVEFYFDPQVCMTTWLYGDLKFRDGRGEVQHAKPKKREVKVVCPILFTRSSADTATLRKLVEETLSHKDRKVFRYPDGQGVPAVFELAKEVVSAVDLQSVREFREATPFRGEGWFYGETSQSASKVVVRVTAREDLHSLEFFVAADEVSLITGLLAEFQHRLLKIHASRGGNVMPIQVTDAHEVGEQAQMPTILSQQPQDGGQTARDDKSAP